MHGHEPVDGIGVKPRKVAKRPADRFPDEELRLVRTDETQAKESFAVGLRTLTELMKDRHPGDPEVRVGAPPIQVSSTQFMRSGGDPVLETTPAGPARRAGQGSG